LQRRGAMRSKGRRYRFRVGNTNS